MKIQSLRRVRLQAILIHALDLIFVSLGFFSLFWLLVWPPAPGEPRTFFFFVCMFFGILMCARAMMLCLVLLVKTLFGEQK
jgi:hypothetical protein